MENFKNFTLNYLLKNLATKLKFEKVDDDKGTNPIVLTKDIINNVAKPTNTLKIKISAETTAQNEIEKYKIITVTFIKMDLNELIPTSTQDISASSISGSDDSKILASFKTDFFGHWPELSDKFKLEKVDDDNGTNPTVLTKAIINNWKTNGTLKIKISPNTAGQKEFENHKVVTIKFT